jgi:hypothetical protein
MSMSRKTELIRRNILIENDLIEIEMMTAKLSNVRTNNILMIHQMNKVSHQRSLYEFGRWSE